PYLFKELAPAPAIVGCEGKKFALVNDPASATDPDCEARAPKPACGSTSTDRPHGNVHSGGGFSAPFFLPFIPPTSSSHYSCALFFRLTWFAEPLYWNPAAACLWPITGRFSDVLSF
ncbi:MAG: hypothetical protein M0017_00945, partial [Desulfobacteraceae bacterium]|nr:hypothetical protein [Desulfobacteraceae bacterium]